MGFKKALNKMREQDKNFKPFSAGFETYLSPFTFRYASDQMREIWSRRNFWLKVRDIWIAGARAQQMVGLVTQEEVDDLIKHRDVLSVERIDQIEKVMRHDVIAAIQEFSEVAPVGGRILHQGFTSEDVLSNAEAMQIRESFEIVEKKLVGTLGAFGRQIDEHKDLVCVGWTHLQAAEPTTVGYRFAKYGQDLLIDLELLRLIKPFLKGKGIKGAVGTSASFTELLKGTKVSSSEHERLIMEQLGIEAFTVSDQTYPRKALLLTQSVLSGIGQSLHRFALDLQILQSSSIDEVCEPRGKGQPGSSAMPHKQNPIIAENIDSLTEMILGEFVSSWITASFVTLERTLRDSAGKRSWLPESFLIIDEALGRAEKIMKGLVINKNSIATNLKKFAPFFATERLLAKLTSAGMDRKKAHEILVELSETAVSAIRNGHENPMRKLVNTDGRITSLLSPKDIKEAFGGVYHHVGDAPFRCLEFLEKELYPAIGKPDEK